jgi:hypothetical protein
LLSTAWHVRYVGPTRSPPWADAALDPALRAPGQAYPSLESAVADLTQPADRVWCYPRADPYTRTRRLSASRYFTPNFLSRPEAQAEVFAALRRGAARLVLIDWLSVQRGRISSCFELRDRPAFHSRLTAVLDEYFVFRGGTGPWSIYEFRGTPAPG